MMLVGNTNWVLSNTDSKGQKNYATALASIDLADGRQPKHGKSTHFIPRKANPE